ncbi:MAG: aminodeoxychorismate synthase component I [Parachlamydiaceae bacterium]|nr:aminodeoxychorismate synthase component I [Parachlamydiaceae bacterium]
MTKVIKLPKMTIDRSQLLHLARFFSKSDGCCFLYAGKAEPNSSSTFSFLCLFPYETIVITPNLQRYEQGKRTIALSKEANPWDGLKRLFPRFNKLHSTPEWVGFFSYEMGAYSDQEMHCAYTPAKTPDSYFQRSALTLKVDHITNCAELLFEESALEFLEEEFRGCVEALLDPDFWPDLLEVCISDDSTDSEEIPFTFESFESQESYSKKIQQIQEWISAGDVYQVNLSQQFLLNGKKDPYKIFETLAQNNPAPFSAFMNFKDYTIISSSPESFLKKKQGLLETRPIKGTAPRGKSAEEDAHNREMLLNSPKEKAELLMIVDLMRNDLGKISEPGSVNVSKIWECETYTNVFHLVSTICSTPIPTLDSLDLIRSCFPGGSITGCPKLRAIDAISLLEKRPRGIYTGSIGYFAGNGDFDFNIAIRTITYCEGKVDVQLGGGIVIDSDPDREYAETFHKGASIFKALGVTHDFL